MTHVNVDEIFDHTSFTIDREAHIVLDLAACRACSTRPCTTACPARCYSWSEEDQRLTFVYDGCLECGTCYILCPGHFTLWHYPRGGFGVGYRQT